MGSIYKIENLSFSYGKSEILKDLNLNIKEGEFVGIVGNNGSGKSTLLKLMVSQLKKYEGDIKIFGEDIANFYNWNRIGYVPQVDNSKTIAFPISVKEMVVLNLYKTFNIFNHPTRANKKTVMDTLKIFNIEGLANKNYNDLSGGQKQKVMIAKAMVHNPDLLIFDEPTVGVDKESKEDFFKMLDHINKFHNVTIIMVTHEMDVAGKYFTRKLTLKDKKIYA